MLKKIIFLSIIFVLFLFGCENVTTTESVDNNTTTTKEDSIVDNYQVNESYFNTYVTMGGYVSSISNLTIVTSYTNNSGVAQISTLYNDYGKMHFVSGGYEHYIKLNDDGSLDIHIKADGRNYYESHVYTKKEAEEFLNMLIDAFLRIEFSDLKYDNETHEYKYDGIYKNDALLEDSSYKNIAFKFENNQLKEIRYEDVNDSEAVNITFRDYGTTSVVFPEFNGPIEIQKIEFEQETYELKVGESVKLLLNVIPSNASAQINYDFVNFSTTSTDLISIDESGIAHALKAGTAIINATFNNFTASCNVVITEEKGAYDDVMLVYFLSSFDGANYSDSLTNDDINNLLSKVSIKITKSGDDSKYVIYSLNDDDSIYYALFGNCIIDENNCALAEPTSYYDGEKGQYRHRYHMDSYNQYALFPGSLEYDEKTNSYSFDSYVGKSHNDLLLKGTFKFVPNVGINPPTFKEDTNDDYYEPLIENKRFDYALSINSSTNQESVNDEFKNGCISFFKDNKVEIYYPKLKVESNIYDVDVLYKGSFYIDEATDKYELKIVIGEVYYDNLLCEGLYYEYHYLYDAKNNIITSVSDKEEQLIHKFNLSDVTPTKYELSLYDEWDDKEVEETINSISNNFIMPHLSNVKTFEIKNVDTDNKSFEINAKMTYLTNNAYSQFLDSVNDSFIMIYDTELNEVYYLTKDGLSKIYLDLNNETGINIVKIIVSEHKVEYPSLEIDSYLNTCDFNDDVIDFYTPLSNEYKFSDGTLTISLLDSANSDEIISSFVNELKKIGYKEYLYNDTNVLYVSKNRKLAIKFNYYVYENEKILDVYYSDASSLPRTDYPGDLVDEYLSGLNDKCIDFSYDGATFTYNTPFEYKYQPFFNITIKLPKDTNADTALNSFKNSLIELEYFIDNVQITYYTKDDNEKVDRSLFEQYVSKNKEIIVSVTGYDDTYEQVSYVDVSIGRVSTLSSASFDSDIVTIIRLNVENINDCERGHSYEFIGTVTAIYSDGTTKVLSSDEYYLDIMYLDTSKNGTYPVYVVYEEYREEISVLVK